MSKWRTRTALVRTLVFGLVVATGAHPTSAQVKQSRANVKRKMVRRQFSKNDLFNTFSDLDRNLTALDRQMEALKASANVASPGTANPTETKTTIKKTTSGNPALRRPWVPIVRRMWPTVLNIQRDAERIHALYRTRERQVHKRPFKRLSADAAGIRRQLNVVGAARTLRWERVVQARLSKAVLSFVVHFQGVSGGYGALRCEPGEQSCCEPKRSTRKSPYDSCRWVCVKRVEACRSGFPGPSIAPNFQHTGLP
jgi:hypothetical protein